MWRGVALCGGRDRGPGRSYSSEMVDQDQSACLSCGYDLRGLASICPECGADQVAWMAGIALRRSRIARANTVGSIAFGVWSILCLAAIVQWMFSNIDQGGPHRTKWTWLGYLVVVFGIVGMCGWCTTMAVLHLRWPRDLCLAGWWLGFMTAVIILVVMLFTP